MDRRCALGFVLAGLSAACLSVSTAAHAEPAFKQLLPFLIDIDGWQGQKANGMSMNMSDTDMTTATREYRRGNATINISIVSGQAATGAMAPITMGMNIETDDAHVLATTISGMKASKSFNKKDNSGAIIVALGESALFSFGYNGMSEDEATPLVQKFDLKGIAAAAATAKK